MDVARYISKVEETFPGIKVSKFLDYGEELVFTFKTKDKSEIINKIAMNKKTMDVRTFPPLELVRIDNPKWIDVDQSLAHYGMPRRSGRYPWGSGENPYHHSGHSKNYATLLDSKLKHKKTAGSQKDDKAKANVHYVKEKFDGAHMNCYSCALAYDMRRRGYDVTAKKSVFKNAKNPNKFNKYTTIDNLKTCYVDGDKNSAKIHFSKDDNAPKRESMIQDYGKKFPDGSRGIISMRVGMGGSGHSMAWEKENGRINLYETQDPKDTAPYKKRDMTHIFKYTEATNKDSDMASVEIMRTDDLQPTDEILKYVKNL